MIQHGQTDFRPDRQGLDMRSQSEMAEKLAESQRQFQSVLKSLSGLFYRCEVRPPWRMSFVSDGVETLTGFSAHELSSMGGWSTIIRAEDRGDLEKSVARAVAQGRSFDLLYCITRKCGELRWVSERGHAVHDDTGLPLFLEGVITDVSGRKESEEFHKRMLERSRRTLDAIPQMVWTMSGDGTDEFYNAQWMTFTGCWLGQAGGPTRADLIHVDDRARAMAQWEEKFAEGEPYEIQYRLRHVTGGHRWILSRGEPEKNAAGKTIRWYGTCTDIHEQVCGRQALQESEAITRSMIEASPDCIALLDVDGNTSFLNSASIEAFGRGPAQLLLGQPWVTAFPDSFRGPALGALTQAAAGRTGRFTASQPSAYGQRWWDVMIAPIMSEGTPTGLISIARDITHQKTAEERIRWAANHDPLTQLPNRALFQRTLDRSLARHRDGGPKVTVLMLDLDDFKRTNDALGHDAGDALLSEFAERLRKTLRAEDMVARLGGDEFAVILNGVSDSADIESAVGAILAGLRAPCAFEGKLLDIRTSIGASSFPAHGETPTELMKHADIALYAAKASGRGNLKIFQASMRAAAQERSSMLGLARDAIYEERIRANYQPKVDLRSGQLDGFEALLRWNHPTKGLQTPDTIAAAFQDGLLAVELSDRMIEAVVADMRRWTDAGIGFGHVAINAAAAEFKNGAFAEKLLTELHRADLPTSCLQLEVTETVFLGRGAEYVEDTLRQLSAEGIRIALDDFGTGYASLSHLNKFPVDVIKVDRSFIKRLDTSAHDAAIVRAVIKLGRSLGIKIIAEGIETQQQAAFLIKNRCHSGQGFLFGKAVPASEVPLLVANWGLSRTAA